VREEGSGGGRGRGGWPKPMACQLLSARCTSNESVYFRLRVEGEVGEEGSGGGMGGRVEWGGRALLYKKFTKGHLFPR